MKCESDAIRLTCPLCRWSCVYGAEEMARRLSHSGILRRSNHLDPKMLAKLFLDCVDQFACRKCQAQELAAVEVFLEEEDDEAWGMARLCRQCKKPIPLERLEIFPDEKLCATCKEKELPGDDFDEPEYCPACGAILVMRQSRSSGISRYVMACGECRWKSR